MILFIVAIFISGLIVGALGRLVVPGPNPMGILSTAAVGILGSFVGGIIGRAIFGLRYRYSFGLAFVVAVLCTALIVFLLQRRHRSRL